MEKEPKGCEECVFLLREDVGYSNWTVEDTVLYCLKDLNPKLPTEEPYPVEKVADLVDFGRTCPGRIKGVPLYVDVDREDDPAKDESILPEVLELYRRWDK